MLPYLCFALSPLVILLCVNVCVFCVHIFSTNIMDYAWATYSTVLAVVFVFFIVGGIMIMRWRISTPSAGGWRGSLTLLGY